MANSLFRKDAQKRWAGAGSFDYATADIRIAFIDTATDDPNPAIGGDEFLSDILAGARVSVTGTLANASVVDGVFDHDDVTIPDTGGASIEKAVYYNHTGVEATSALGIHIDTATGLPLTPDSVDDLYQAPALGVAVFF